MENCKLFRTDAGPTHVTHRSLAWASYNIIMPRRRHDLLYDISLVVASASTGAYGGLSDRQLLRQFRRKGKESSVTCCDRLRRLPTDRPIFSLSTPNKPAVGVYWSLLQMQRRYWRYRVSRLRPCVLVLLALCLFPLAHSARGWAPLSGGHPPPPPPTPPPPPADPGNRPPSFSLAQGKAKARIPLVLLQSEWSQAVQMATEAALQAGHNIRAAQERESNRNVQYKGDIDL